MRSKRFFAFLLAVLFCIPGMLRAKDIGTYSADVSVTIEENDIAFARNSAFQNLQSLILSLAIQELIGYSLYQEYSDTIFRSKSIQPSNFLISAKILDESVSGDTFYMKMEAKIQLVALSEALRKLNLILKDDPWYSVDVFVEEGIDLSESDLETRLELFHIKIKKFQHLNLSSIPPQQRSNSEFIKILFDRFASSRVIYLIDTVSESQPGEVKFMRTQIFRKSDLSQINTFQLALPESKEVEELGDRSVSRFLKQFTLQSIKSNIYEQGIETKLAIVVEGLVEPYVQKVFEEKMLDNARFIRSYQLTGLSRETAYYQLQTNFDLEELYRYFQAKNSFFYFIVEKKDANSLVVECFHRFGIQETEPLPWEADNRIITMIKESMLDESELPDEEARKQALEQELNEVWFPELMENEPNNSSKNLNTLPPSTLLIGFVSSRADEDIFKIRRNSDSNTLVVQWVRIGKTTLSPQLRLYDDDFHFLASYGLIGSQNKLSFKHEFRNGSPKYGFLRITDKVGFIQGETGGFKSFYYLLRYYWLTDEMKFDPDESLHLPKVSLIR